jgi:hypothetical protein
VEQAISEILIADTDSESGDEAGDVEEYFEEDEEEEQEEQPASAEVEPQAISGDYQPGDCLKEGTQIFICLLVHQKVSKK